jgi:8-oxo-dGTP pyrophosphatase MutT (NUDIX family)/SAM-dependent methyltransferase
VTDGGVTRDWAVAVFVVWRDRVMLHRHPKLGMWLPCGGHVEPGELPDDAAVRELHEESGVRVRLVGPHPVHAPGPRPLTRPRGVQLETIADGHEHVDLVYWAVPEEPYDGGLEGDPTLAWCDRDALERLPLSAEIAAWARLALDEVGDAAAAPASISRATPADRPIAEPTDLLSVVHRSPHPVPWAEGDNIPWHEPGFSARMLDEHLSQAHDAASRRTPTIERQVVWIHETLLDGTPTEVLDLGCGPGLYTERLAALGHRCVGIDVSPASIAFARGRAATAGDGLRYVEGDVRSTDLGHGYGLATMLFGEFNTLPREDAAALLRRAHAALADGGILLLEPHTAAAVRAIGHEPARWSTAESGLFSDAPHLLLTESSWDEDARAATVRHLVVDAATAGVTRHAQTFAAYDETAYRAALAEAGFVAPTFLPSLTGDAADAQPGLLGIVARKAPSAA